VGAVFSLVSEGENGHIVPRDDPVALADAIARLLDDREAAARMGRAARESVEVRFASGVATERLERVYSSVVEEAV
jgi:glycosyltransferase involved in cell wall biosynthesis